MEEPNYYTKLNCYVTCCAKCCCCANDLMLRKWRNNWGFVTVVQTGLGVENECEGTWMEHKMERFIGCENASEEQVKIEWKRGRKCP